MPESIFELKKYSDKTVRHVNGDINLLENLKESNKLEEVLNTFEDEVKIEEI